MSKKPCLCGCGDVLTGHQRMFAHGDVCRMRYNRQQEKSERESEQKSELNCSVSFGNRSVLPSLTEREVTMELSIRVVFGVKGPSVGDDYLLNKPLRDKLAQVLTNFLAQWHPDARIVAIKVEKKAE